MPLAKFSKPLSIMCMLFATLALSGCKKASDNPTDNSASTNTSVLISSSWKIVKIDYQKTDGTWIADPNASALSSIIVTFASAGTFTELYNGNGSSGVWNFSADNSQLVIIGGNQFAGTYTINTLSKTSLIITNNYYPFPGYKAYQSTYSH